MSLTYATYVNSLANLLPVPSNDPGFVTVLPNIIDDAEQRIYRELDLLNTIISDTTTTTTAGANGYSLPTTQGTFVTVQNINIITPAGTQPHLGTRNPCTPVSVDTVLQLYPSSVDASVPRYFAMVTQASLFFGPWSDQAYTVEILGTVRPQPLSASNTTTLLSTGLPDLFLAASMVFASAYQKNFGAAVDDPQMSQTWESHYQALFQSANTEEMRKKFNSQAWTSRQPAPLAQPPRS